MRSHPQLPTARDRARQNPRITSYNVCYTKLLRLYGLRISSTGGNEQRFRRANGALRCHVRHARRLPSRARLGTGSLVLRIRTGGQGTGQQSYNFV